MQIEVGNLKMAREHLCRIQLGLNGDIYGMATESDYSWIQKTIDEIDKLRPLGSNGKHGKLHTPWCGCEDAGKFCKMCDLPVVFAFDDAEGDGKIYGHLTIGDPPCHFFYIMESQLW